MIVALNLILIFMMMIPAAAASRAAVSSSSSSLATSASKMKIMTMKTSYSCSVVEKTSPVMAFVRTSSPSIQQRRHGQQQQSGLRQQRHGYHYMKFYQTNYHDQLSKFPSSMLRLTNESLMIRSTTSSYHSSSSMSLLSMPSSLPTLEQVSFDSCFVFEKEKSPSGIFWKVFSYKRMKQTNILWMIHRTVLMINDD